MKYGYILKRIILGKESFIGQSEILCTIIRIIRQRFLYPDGIAKNEKNFACYENEDQLKGIVDACFLFCASFLMFSQEYIYLWP